jgi:hypothetical protein
MLPVIREASLFLGQKIVSTIKNFKKIVATIKNFVIFLKITLRDKTEFLKFYILLLEVKPANTSKINNNFS